MNATPLLAKAPGIDVNPVDEKGRTTLRLASEKGNTEMVRVLLASPGIDVNRADKDGETPLYGASSGGHLEVVKLLLAGPGIIVNQADKDGETPLFGASDNCEIEVVKLLLAAPGIGVFNKNKEGKSALDVASGPAVASLLEEAVDVKRTYGALLLALMHHGVSRAEASDVAMHGLPSAHARGMAEHMRDTWPPAPRPNAPGGSFGVTEEVKEEDEADRLIVDDAVDARNDNSSVALHPLTMDALGLTRGDSVLLKGKKKRDTVCLVFGDDTMDAGKVRMNEVVCSNLRIRLGDVVSIHQGPNVPFGKWVRVLPMDDTIEGLNIGENDLFNQFLMPYFKESYRPVRKGDLFLVREHGRAVEFKVIACDPHCIVSFTTEIFSEGEPLSRRG